MDAETYIGGKVECLRSGVYRSDLEQDFVMDPSTLQGLWDGCERVVRFMAFVEKKEFEECEIQRVTGQIRDMLQKL